MCEREKLFVMILRNVVTYLVSSFFIGKIQIVIFFQHVWFLKSGGLYTVRVEDVWSCLSLLSSTYCVCLLLWSCYYSSLLKFLNESASARLHHQQYTCINNTHKTNFFVVCVFSSLYCKRSFVFRVIAMFPSFLLDFKLAVERTDVIEPSIQTIEHFEMFSDGSESYEDEWKCRILSSCYFKKRKEQRYDRLERVSREIETSQAFAVRGVLHIS